MTSLVDHYRSVMLNEYRWYASDTPGGDNFELFTCFERDGDHIVGQQLLDLKDPPISLHIGDNYREQPLQMLLQSTTGVSTKIRVAGSGSMPPVASISGKVEVTFTAKNSFILLIASGVCRQVINVNSYADQLHQRLKEHPDVTWTRAPLHRQPGTITEVLRATQMVALISERAGSTASVDITASAAGLVDGAPVKGSAAFESFGDIQSNGVLFVKTPAGTPCTPLFRMMQFNQRLFEQPKFVALP